MEEEEERNGTLGLPHSPSFRMRLSTGGTIVGAAGKFNRKWSTANETSSELIGFCLSRGQILATLKRLRLARLSMVCGEHLGQDGKEAIIRYLANAIPVELLSAYYTSLYKAV